jgi:hypothetical protein
LLVWKYAATASFWYAGCGKTSENPPPVVQKSPKSKDAEISPITEHSFAPGFVWHAGVAPLEIRVAPDGWM